MSCLAFSCLPWRNSFTVNLFIRNFTLGIVSSNYTKIVIFVAFIFLKYSNSKCNIFCSPIKLLDGELLQKMEQDPLAESLNDLFTNVSMMIRGELQV